MKKMRTVLATAASTFVLAVAVVAVSSPARAASLVEVTNFGNNPGSMRMHIYVPDVRPASPAIVVAMHGCSGSGTGFYSSSEFASLSNQYGFIVIYPTATQSAGFGNCFDTWSSAAKVRGGGSDPVSIASMVAYAQQQYNGDLNRVYATGSSSGGMMTQHMLAVYPDLFKAGASFMGVPFGCFANAADYPPSTSQCTTGQIDRTPQQWGDLARQAYPGYSGPRPRVQLWHGTSDNLVPYSRLNESIEQWTNVFGLSQTPTSADTPQTNWNRRRYANGSGTVQVEAYGITGAGHSLPSSGMALVAIQFFGLTSTTPSPTASPTSSPTPSPTPSGSAFSLVGTGSAKCVHVPGASQTNGTGLVIYTCSGATNQRWMLTAASELRIYNNSKCMQAGTSAGSRAVINSCAGGNNQKWTFNSNGTISNVQSGLCLDVSGASTANNAAVQVWTCHSGSNQRWTRQS